MLFRSKFDNYLLLKSLQYNDYRPQVIMQDNSILTISYSNVIVKDLIRLYPGSNLAGCFKVFKTKPFHGAKVPSADKWECFPYKLISRMLTESFSIDYLRSHPDVWGGKFADYDSHGDVPTYQTACDTNCDWWLRHVGNTAGYNELVRYCNDDTQILLYCAIIHQMVIAQGVINERPFNLTKCYTIASSSLHLFQQCFLEQPIASNANEFKSGLFFENGEEVSVSYLIDESYKGGYVNTFSKGSNNVEFEQEWKDSGIPHKISYVDINSSYPAVMVNFDMPTSIESVTTLLKEVTKETVDDHTIYVCDVDYPLHSSGLMIKCMGMCVSPSSIPHRYKDSKSKTRPVERFSCHWGVEIREALDAGATIMSYVSIKFHHSRIFDKYISFLYKERLKAKGFDPDTLEKIPGAPVDALMEYVFKIYMNGFYGKFGQKIGRAHV